MITVDQASKLFMQVLTKDQRAKAYKAFTDNVTCNKQLQAIIADSMPEIDKLTGQSNVQGYMAYLLEFVFLEKGAL